MRYTVTGDIMKIKDDFILKEIAGSYVVVPVRQRSVDFSGIIKLTESGAFLWKILINGAEKQDLVSALLDEYEVDEATAAADVDRFISSLNDADILE